MRTSLPKSRERRPAAQTHYLTPDRTSASGIAILAAIVGLGAILRFVPIWFGLPFDEARPDESVAIGHALAVLDGHLNPHFFHWPSLTFYLFAAWFAIASWIPRALGLDPVLTGNEQFLIARTVVACAGTLTIVALFALTRRVADETSGLAAAFFLAVAALHVRDSHFAMTDVLMTAFATISLACLTEAFARARADGPDAGTARGFALAGLACGLAASTKYSGGALVAAMAAVQADLVARHRRSAWSWRTWRPSVAFLSAAAIAFVAATPFALLDARSFVGGVAFDVRHLSSGHGIDEGIGWIYHLTRSLPYGVGIPVFVAAIAGVPLLGWRYRSRALVVGAFAAAFFAVIASGRTVFFRYVLPLVPIVCLSAAVAVETAGEWLARRTRLAARVVVVAIAAAVGAVPLVASVRLDTLLARTDTRVLAGQWLAAHVRPGQSVYEAGSIYTRTSLFGVPVHRWSAETFNVASGSFAGANGDLPDWLVVPQSPVSIYTDIPPALGRLVAERYELADRVDATREPDDGVYDPQDAFFLPIARFGSVLRPGPTLSIYHRRD